MKPLFLACGMLGSLVISGCATTQTTNTANINGSATPTATIQGSIQMRFARMYDDRIAYPIAIDGNALVPATQLATQQQYSGWWETLHPITAGEHTVSVQYRMAGLYTVPVNLTFNAKVNHQYQINFDTDMGVSANSPNTYADFWVTDNATKKTVSAVVRANRDPKSPGYLSTFLQNHMPPLVIPEPSTQPMP